MLNYNTDRIFYEYLSEKLRKKKKMTSCSSELRTKKNLGIYMLIKGANLSLYRAIKGKEIIKKALPPLIMKIQAPAARIKYSRFTD